MSGVGISWGFLNSAEHEEFLAAVIKQSIGRPYVVQPSKTLVGPTERRVDGVKPSLRPVLPSTNYVARGAAPLDSNQTTIPQGAATGKAEKAMMMMMTMAKTPAPTIKPYAKPSLPAPSTSRQMNTARTTLTSSVMPLRLKTAQHQQPKAIATGLAMATIPTATSAHRLVQVERKYQAQIPLASPLQDVADRWARELDAARERRKELKRQFKRDFVIGYSGYYYHY